MVEIPLERVKRASGTLEGNPKRLPLGAGFEF